MARYWDLTTFPAAVQLPPADLIVGRPGRGRPRPPRPLRRRFPVRPPAAPTPPVPQPTSTPTTSRRGTPS
jgi:hypothetical protein